MRSKPIRYGIRCWMLVSNPSQYIFNVIPYLAKAVVLLKLAMTKRLYNKNKRDTRRLRILHSIEEVSLRITNSPLVYYKGGGKGPQNTISYKKCNLHLKQMNKPKIKLISWINNPRPR
jgi:hypothetical protein